MQIDELKYMNKLLTLELKLFFQNMPSEAILYSYISLVLCNPLILHMYDRRMFKCKAEERAVAVATVIDDNATVGHSYSYICKF